MSKQSLLLVDGDTRSLRVLEVSLRKAGFSVTPAVSVGDALEKLEINPPDLIISETKFSTDLDGFELRRRLRSTPEWAEIPFIFLTAETAIENKIKGLELGVDDYLTKPIYIKEIVTRINILLQKRQRQFLDLRKDGTRFAGRVTDMPVVDVIQTVEVSRKSGVIQFSGGPNRQATIYFRDGKVIDAEAGTLQGEDAVYRLLTWNEGEFEVEFRTVRRREVIEASSQGMLMEGMRRLDEWSRLLEQLPPLTHRFEIDAVELSTRLGEVPDDNNRILRLFDGKRTLLEVIDASDFGDLECLQAISRLYFEGLLLDLDPTTRREPSRPMPVANPEDSGLTPMQRATSGPIDVATLEASASHRSTGAPVLGGASPDVTTPVEAADVIGSEPLVAPRARRESSQAIDESDVVGEQDEVRSPLTGGYRQSSLRLIDEAVAAAQLIEPSLFADEELAALGIKRATPAELAAAAAANAATPPGGVEVGPSQPPAEEKLASIARVKLEPRTPDPRVENARDLVEKQSNGVHGVSGRKTPLPLGLKAQDNDAPLLDAGVLRNASAAELAPQVPLLAPIMQTSSSDPPSMPKREEEPVATTDTTKPEIAAAVETKPPAKAVETDDGIPKEIGGEDLADEGATSPSGKGPKPLRPDDSQPVKMIGSLGRDRAEAFGELRPLSLKESDLKTQRELVTIMPRRKTGEIAQLKPEDVATLDSKGQAKAKAIVEAVDAKLASEQAEADAKAKGDGGTKPAGDPKVDGAKPAARSALESPPRRVSVEGGVVAPARGLGRLAQGLIGLAVVLGGVAVYSKCGKSKPAPSAAVPQDAGERVVMKQPDAGELIAFGADAGVQAPIDAGTVATIPADAAVARTPDDAGTVATVVDAGVDKTAEAAALATKGREALADGEPELAVDFFNQSLQVRKDRRTYVDRGRAFHNMGRTAQAIESIDLAIAMSRGYVTAWEHKGLILWSAQRYAEARPVLEKYLELSPNGPKAATFRAMLDEPR